jgi:RNA 2',3'-cyclic 3'-phosphodiesterase
MSQIAQGHGPPRRLFFALWPADSTRQQITRVTADRIQCSGGRATVPDNLHVTLAFLGRIGSERFADLERAAELARCGDPFRIVFDRIEYWPAVRLLCLTPSTLPKALIELVERLRYQLLAADFPLETRPWRAHVTLARNVAPQSVVKVAAIEWPVDSLALVESQQSSAGSTYRVVVQWPLQNQ